MKRALFLPIIVLGQIAYIEAADAQVGLPWPGPGGVASAAPYVGPCDLTSVSCATAYSLSRAMSAAYTGNLFKLGRASDSTTLTVGQVNHLADLSGVYNFAKGTEIFVIERYDHIGSNTKFSARSDMPSTLPACNNATFVCAPEFLLDPATGKPVIRTTYPTGFALALDGVSTGINAGNNAMSQWLYGTNAGYTSCCGTPSLGTHSWAEANTIGTYFGLWNSYGNVDDSFFSCSTSTSQCVGNSWESADRDGADFSGSGNLVLASMGTYDGAAATNTIKIYANSATPVYTKSPPCPVINTAPCLYGVNTINVGKHIHDGFGGDTSQIDKVTYEEIISNGVLTAADFTALKNDADTFYAASPPTCAGVAGLSMAWNPTGAHDTYAQYYNSLYAYGLYQMRADYWGPIADLRDALGTTNTYYPASSGCVIDTAAATFCAANPPCTLAKEYNQGTFSPSAKMHRDSAADAVQAVVANQPIVTFSSLNGKPTIDTSGGRFLKTGLISVTMLPTIISAVAKRTGNFTSFQEIISTYPDFPTILGYSNGADTVNTYDGVTSVTSTASDSHWHSIVAEADNTGGGAGRLYVDNVGGGTEGTGWATNNFHIAIGSGTDGTTQPCTCQIAEVAFLTNYKPGSTANNKVGYDPQHTAIFNAHQTAWGTLPN